MSVIDLTKKAAVSLEKKGLTGQRAAVYLVLDHSGSMQGFYRDGSVQALAERTLGLSANLDDDGEVPVVFFHSGAERPVTVSLDSYQGFVAREEQRVNWGSTNYVAAMQRVVTHYQDSGAKDPALVVFQTDGEPDSREHVRTALRTFSSQPLLWAFVGFGPKRHMTFLTELAGLSGRQIRNTSLFHAEKPGRVSDEELYDHLAGELAGYLGAARQAGVVR